MNAITEKLYEVSPSIVQTIILNLYALGIHKERFRAKFNVVLLALEVVNIIPRARSRPINLIAILHLKRSA